MKVTFRQCAPLGGRLGSNRAQSASLLELLSITCHDNHGIPSQQSTQFSTDRILNQVGNKPKKVPGA